MVKRYYRAFIARYGKEDERVYFDFSCDGDAMEYAQSQGFGNVIMVSTLPICYSPYLTAYEPTHRCNGECPDDSARKFKNALDEEVLTGRGNMEFGGIRHAALGSCCAVNSPTGISKRNRIKCFLNFFIN